MLAALFVVAIRLRNARVALRRWDYYRASVVSASGYELDASDFGKIANVITPSSGIGAAILRLLAITGLALWWPGIKIWTCGLRVGLGHSWRRINFDAHNAIGF